MSRNCLIFAFIICQALLVGCSSRRAGTSQDEKLTLIGKFAAIKESQMLSISRRRHIAVPAEFRTLMEAARVGDWLTVSNLYQQVRMRSDWYGDSRPDAAIANELWFPVHEVYFAFETIRRWDLRAARTYVDKVFEKIPARSVLLAGTDDTRFLCSLFREAKGYPDTIIIAQASLVHSAYIQYLRDLYGSQILIPSWPDDGAAVVQMINKSGSTREAWRYDDGRVAPNGYTGLWAIAEGLSFLTFDRNKKTHSFFFEQAFVFPTFLPYLKPNGLIMKITPLSCSLSDTESARDMADWDMYERLFVREGVPANFECAERTLAHLRLATVSLYAFRGLYREAEAAFKQAQRWSGASCEPILLYVSAVLIPQYRFAEARTILSTFQREHPGVCKEAVESMKRMLAEKEETSERGGKGAIR